MSYTYEDRFDEACYQWAELDKRANGPDPIPGRAELRDELDQVAAQLLRHYLDMRSEDCGHCRVAAAYNGSGWHLEDYDAKLRPLPEIPNRRMTYPA